jgi:hypothetical protein
MEIEDSKSIAPTRQYKQFSMNKENIKVFINVEDLKMLMHSTIELGGGIIQIMDLFCLISLFFFLCLSFYDMNARV